MIADLAADHRGPVVELGPDRAFDRLAAVIDPRPGVPGARIDHQADRLELVLVDEERALEILRAVVVDQHAILALGAVGRQDEMGVEAAEGVELDLFLADGPIAGVEDLDRVRLVLVDHVGVVGRAAEAAADVHQLARAIGRPIGVDVALVGQALGDADALEIEHVRGDVAADRREDADVVGIERRAAASTAGCGGADSSGQRRR